MCEEGWKIDWYEASKPQSDDFVEGMDDDLYDMLDNVTVFGIESCDVHGIHRIIVDFDNYGKRVRFDIKPEVEVSQTERR